MLGVSLLDLDCQCRAARWVGAWMRAQQTAQAVEATSSQTVNRKLRRAVPPSWGGAGSRGLRASKRVRDR